MMKNTMTLGILLSVCCWLLQPAVAAADKPLAPILDIEIAALESLLSQRDVLQPENLAQAPYVLYGVEEKILLGPGDLIYARGRFPDTASGRIYQVVRRGQTHLDPYSRELLGLEVEHVGEARMIGVENSMAILKIDSARDTIVPGNWLVPYKETRALEAMVPQEPEFNFDAEILTLPEGFSQAGMGDWVVVNKGAREGMRVGDRLALVKTGDNVIDPLTGESLLVPNRNTGQLVIFRVYGKLSYGVIVESHQPVTVGDRARHP